MIYVGIAVSVLVGVAIGLIGTIAYLAIIAPPNGRP
jgi:hypothetical protein